MDWKNENQLDPEQVEELLDKTVHTDKKTGTTYETTNCTISNFLIILKNDRYFRNVCFDTMREAPIVVKDLHEFRLWGDQDFSQTRLHIEQAYKLTGREKIQDAFNVLCSERRYSPIQEIIKSVKWDGIKRCENFFIKWAMSPDDNYSRECSRLVFAQGIARAFAPGSKCDYVVVLFGKQGKAKSTMVNWLAIDDQFYLSLKSIKNKENEQQLCGKWIAELEELLATVNGNSSAEQAKQFISSRIDNFRQPYARYPVDHKRSCIFIGTTNRQKFLSDPTGNRRWFPLAFEQEGDFLFDHEQECKDEILQCWAEMYSYWQSGSEMANTYPNRSLLGLIEGRQSAAEEDDPELGIIEDYLKYKEKVCLIEVCEKALHYEFSKMKKPERNAISAKLTGSRLGCTVKMNKAGDKPSPDRFGDYGTQQAYMVPDRLYHFKEEPEEPEKPVPAEPIQVEIDKADLPF